MNDSVCKEALVIPINTLSAVAGVLPSDFNFSLLVNSTLIIIFYKSFRKIFIFKRKDKSIEKLNLNKFDKAWWTASFTFFFSQLFDIQYYDPRLNMIFWIFISGLIVIIQDPKGENEKLSKI